MVLGDTGGVLVDDVFEAEFVELTFKGFPQFGDPQGKEEVINATTSAEILWYADMVSKYP